jgi:hypothetical protein
VFRDIAGAVALTLEAMSVLVFLNVFRERDLAVAGREQPPDVVTTASPR